MRAISLPQSLLAGAARALGGPQRQLGYMGAQPRKIMLGDPVISTATGQQVGDTGDISSLPSDYSEGLASGVYYIGTAQGASPSNAVPGDVSAPSSWLTSLTSALPSLSSFITAQQLAQVNVNRAKQGLPALQASAYAPQVGVSVAPETMKMATIAAVALGGIIVLPKLLKRGRR